MEVRAVRLLVSKAAMVRNGGAARDLLRNLPELSRKFEVKFCCLNILDSQREKIESLGVEVICPDNQWEAKGGVWNEISAKQDRSSKKAWEALDGIREAIEWADAIHLTTGAGSMDFTSLVPNSKPLHLHFLESKPGVFDNVSHLNSDGTGKWRAHVVHALQIYNPRRIIASFKGFNKNEKWVISANSNYSASKLMEEYGIAGGVLFPVVDLSEFQREPFPDEDLVFDRMRGPNESEYVVTIGNLSRFKGAYESVEHVAGCNLDLVLVGGGSDLENQEFVSFGRDLGVNVQVLSNLDSIEMSILMKRSIAVIGLAHGEAFGLTPIESMALGAPPVFVAEGGYRDTIVDGVNGRLVPRGEFDDWRQAFMQARDPETRTRWAESGLFRIEELGLSSENYASQLDERIRLLL
ncbi:MAG: glycosyltransferase family 4 protein [Candidatus Thermoplasmatota archaeon]|nr:glycosyltransferase family 4 protein [Candidatus Thermoplasmatota archaeon]